VNSRHVAVINESFARKFFKNEDPLGKHFGQDGVGSARQYEIVGVTKDARYFHDFSEPIRPFFFLPESQHDFKQKDPSKEASPSSHILHDIVVVIKPGANLSEAQLRQAMASIDPNLPISWIHSSKELAFLQFTQQRLIARLTSFFGLLSLVLASIGLYGVTAYNAGRRTGEIGVRMALGADRGDVIALVLKGAFGLILVGLLIGLPLAFAAGRVLGAQLYGINPYNPVVTLVAITSLGFSAFVASLIPALRASSISPIDALRTE
jgi:ABC-type antimicrobial peptide transport system permease subunit